MGPPNEDPPQSGRDQGGRSSSRTAEDLATARSSGTDAAAAPEEDERTPLLKSNLTSEDDTSAFRRAVHHSRQFSFLLEQTKVERTDIDEDTQLQANKFYQVTKFATCRTFFAYTGTVLQNSILWKETLTVFGIYILIVVLFYHCKWAGFKEFVGGEETIRAFLSMFSNLIGLLLSFYTSLNIGRWWAMRLHVQDLWTSCCSLTVLLAHGVTSDPVLLNSIHRYARVSLYMIFAVSQGVTHPIETLRTRRLLRDDEAKQMQAVGNENSFAMAAVPWAWLSNAVSTLHKQGLTMGPPHLCSLLSACDTGRQSVTAIQTYLDTPIPMSYLHILGLMVKLHNLFVAALYGMVCVTLLEQREGTREFGVLRTVLRAFCMPFLYNALLIMNVDLTNPFDGDLGDLTFSQFDGLMLTEATMMISAAKHRPDWMEGRKYTQWEP